MPLFLTESNKFASNYKKKQSVVAKIEQIRLSLHRSKYINSHVPIVLQYNAKT